MAYNTRATGGNEHLTYNGSYGLSFLSRIVSKRLAWKGGELGGSRIEERCERAQIHGKAKQNMRCL
jgi:hypothetical protein